MQHANDMAMGQDVSLKVAMLRVLPWVVITLIIAIVLTTLVTTQAITGQKFLPDIPTTESSD